MRLSKAVFACTRELYFEETLVRYDRSTRDGLGYDFLQVVCPTLA